MILILSSAPAQEYGPQAESYPTDGGAAKKVSVKTLKAASIICRDYIERNEIGNRNWSGGQIYQDSHFVAEVSHNGTVWTSDGLEIEL
jgi:hypothetical protein